jgi:hypothetical protein
VCCLIWDRTNEPLVFYCHGMCPALPNIHPHLIGSHSSTPRRRHSRAPRLPVLRQGCPTYAGCKAAVQHQLPGRRPRRRCAGGYGPGADPTIGAAAAAAAADRSLARRFLRARSAAAVAAARRTSCAPDNAAMAAVRLPAASQSGVICARCMHTVVVVAAAPQPQPPTATPGQQAINSMGRVRP